jgi:feruloyl-CoA synthase
MISLSVLLGRKGRAGRARPMPASRARLRFGPPDVEVNRRSDGSVTVKSPHPLGPYPRSITDCLDLWAEAAPNRIFLADRERTGGWRTVSYRDARERVRKLAQAFLDRGLSAERPIAILSGNDIDHALIGLGAMYVGIPYAPISVPYSLVAKDFTKLKQILALLTPDLVFAADGVLFEQAIAAAVAPDVEIVTRYRPSAAGRASTPLAHLLETSTGPAVDTANKSLDPDGVAKILFTSGSTGSPKGVINTQRMMTSNQAMLVDAFPSFAEGPPVLVDWLPWSHTFGANHNFNLVLMHGGTLYIDGGKPMPDAINETVRNLREVAPTIYFNVPRGFEMLLPYLRTDADLRRNLFSRLQCCFYAGAALPPHVMEEYERMALETVGEPIPMLTSLGSTETAPSALHVSDKARRPGVIGIPNAGVEMKLVANAGKFEALLRGPSITPGYWREPELTKAAFDDEGYYRLGDALRFADDDDPEKGFVFDGRIAEDFKLTTGTWVNVGILKARFAAHFAPFARDVIIAGQDRDYVAALVVPDLDACRALAAPESRTTIEALLGDATLRAKLASLLAAFNAEASGASSRILRIALLDEPPSLDTGEMTDKGSINQRAVLKRRAETVEQLYAAPAPARVIE